MLATSNNSSASWLDIAPVSNWHYKTFFKRSDLTTERFVTGKNKAGYALTLSYDPLGNVWMEFALPDRSELELADVLPNYRIDKMPYHYFPIQQAVFSDTQPQRWVKWCLGKPQQNMQLLQKLQQGHAIHISYTVFGGHQEQTQFALTGSRQAIARFLK